MPTLFPPSQRLYTGRRVQGLKWAREALFPPWPKPRARANARGAGIRYERAIAGALPQAKHGLWLEFEDRKGHGFCQPDFILKLTHDLVVLESKLTDTPGAQDQLTQLYLPVVEMVYSSKVRGLVVAKNLTPESFAIAPGILFALAQNSKVVHWLGTGPLL